MTTPTITTVHHYLASVTLKPHGDLVNVSAEAKRTGVKYGQCEVLATVRMSSGPAERLMTPGSARELALRLCEAADLADEELSRLSGRYDDVAEAQS